MAWFSELIQHRRRIAFHRKNGTFNPPRPLDCIVLIRGTPANLSSFLEATTTRTRWPLRIWLCADVNTDKNTADARAAWRQRRIEPHEINVVDNTAADGSAGLSSALMNISADVCVLTEGLVAVPDLGKICWATTLLQLMFDFPHIGWLNASHDCSAQPDAALIRPLIVRGTRRTIYFDKPDTQLALVRRECLSIRKSDPHSPETLLQGELADRFTSGRAHSVIVSDL